MNKLKGFLIHKNFSHKPNYLFEKISYSIEHQNTILFSKRIQGNELSQNEAGVIFGNDYSLCFTNQINPTKIKYLSVLAQCLIFELDYQAGTQEFWIFLRGEQIGHKKDALSRIGKKTSFFGMFGNKNSAPNLEATFKSVLDAISQGTSVSPSISNLLDKQPLQIMKTGSLPSKYLDPFSSSSNNTPFTADHKRLMDLMPTANDFEIPFDTDLGEAPMTEERYAQRIKEYIRSGVVSPAILWKQNPMVVVVYSSDLDAILPFNFNVNTPVAKRFSHLKKGAKLLAVNIYSYEAPSGMTDGVEIDIIEGPESSGMWKSFTPTIVNFVADDDDAPLISYWINRIPEDLWKKTVRLTHEYFRKYPAGFRMGFLMYHMLSMSSFLKKYRPDLYKKHYGDEDA